MKRDIKFRGKRTDNGEWVYGGYSKAEEDDGTLYVFVLDWCSTAKFTDEDTKFTGHRIKPRTLGQYSGLKDKNRVDIYEGDILKTDNGDIVEVRYEKIYASFGLWKKGWAFLHYFHEAVEPQCCEVIGNIYDNPEMIEL